LGWAQLVEQPNTIGPTQPEEERDPTQKDLTVQIPVGDAKARFFPFPDQNSEVEYLLRGLWQLVGQFLRRDAAGVPPLFFDLVLLDVHVLAPRVSEIPILEAASDQPKQRRRTDIGIR
jgi:hypothetical protein